MLLMALRSWKRLPLRMPEAVEGDGRPAGVERGRALHFIRVSTLAAGVMRLARSLWGAQPPAEGARRHPNQEGNPKRNPHNPPCPSDGQAERGLGYCAFGRRGNEPGPTLGTKLCTARHGDRSHFTHANPPKAHGIGPQGTWGTAQGTRGTPQGTRGATQGTWGTAQGTRGIGPEDQLAGALRPRTTRATLSKPAPDRTRLSLCRCGACVGPTLHPYLQVPTQRSGRSQR